MILVIGGAGLIGSHVVRRLGARNCIVVDDMSRGCPENLPLGMDWLLPDEPIAWRYVSGVIFLAARPVFECDNAPDSAWRTMVSYLGDIAGHCAAHGIKLVYASSGSVYGEQEGLLTEDAPLLGTSRYARLKIIGEHVVAMSGCAYTTLRFQSVYGRAELKGYEAVIPKFRRLKQQGQPLPIYGSGQESYDFVYVTDAADAIVRATNQGGEGIYNISTGIPTTIGTLADLIAGENGQVEFVDGPIQISHMRADPSRARLALDWEPKTSLMDGLRLCAE